MSSRTRSVLNVRSSLSPDSVRLVNGNSLCSGRLEVKSEQSWSSVCEDDFDQQDAEVVCRELGCGAPSVLQGALYGEVEAPMWTKEFQCGGHESALLDCRRSDSARSTCSPGKAVGLTCSGRRGAAALIWLHFSSNETHFILLLMTLLFLFRACQVGGRSQSLCRYTGGERNRMETNEGLWLDPEGSSCSLQRSGLWLCCFNRKQKRSLRQTCMVDQI